MNAIVNKVFFMIVFGAISWLGLDGLLVNYYSRSFKTLDIIEIEKEGILAERFVEITNGIATGDFAFSDGIVGGNVLYPLISAAARQQMQINQEPVEVKVLVLRKYVDSGCIYNNTCASSNGAAIMGVVSRGLGKVDKEIGLLFEEDIEEGTIKLAPDVIVLEERELISWYWNLLMFIGGTFLSFKILKSFFRKASSLEDWFYKVAEVDEAKIKKLRKQKDSMNA